jgi:hypothetical protein
MYNGHRFLFKLSFVGILGTLYSCGFSPRFIYWALLIPPVVSALGSYIGHSIFLQWFQSSVDILGIPYSSCGFSPRFIYWALLIPPVVSALGSYIGHSLFHQWFQPSVHILGTPYSSSVWSPRFVYSTPLIPPVIAAPDPYIEHPLLRQWLQSLCPCIQWRNVALSLDIDHTQYFSIYGCSPPLPALTVLLYTQGRHTIQPVQDLILFVYIWHS